MTYTNAELAKMRDALAQMIGTKTEPEVRAYLDEQFPRMPKEMQEELLVSVFITSLREEAEELEAIATIQEEGLEAVKELVSLRNEVETERE